MRFPASARQYGSSSGASGSLSAEDRQSFGSGLAGARAAGAVPLAEVLLPGYWTLKVERGDGFPCFRTGGFMVYYVTIDIHDHESPAGKRPMPSTFEMTHTDFAIAITENLVDARD